MRKWEEEKGKGKDKVSRKLPKKRRKQYYQTFTFKGSME